MKDAKQTVLDAGGWLAAEREKRGPGCSTRLVAAVATILAKRDGNNIVIHQQQLSDLETATADKGPAKLQWWWKYVKAAIGEGSVDEMMTAAAATGWRSPISVAQDALAKSDSEE